MKSHRNHLKVLFSLISIIICVLATIYSLKNTNLAAEIINRCQTENAKERQQCFSTNILGEVEKNPAVTDEILSGLWQLAIEGKIIDDPRIFSDIAHEAGMILAEKNISLEQAFIFCGTTFKQGCMHGVIMEYIDKQYENNFSAQKITTLCEIFTDTLTRTNCIHGIGHEFAAKIQKDLPSVLKLCKPFASDINELAACESGVLMEFSKGEAGSGKHSHAAVSSKELPCGNLPDQYKAICFSAEGSYRQYNPGKENFTTTYQFCNSIPGPYVSGCLLGLSERVLLATAGNKERTDTICQQLPQNQTQGCLDALIQVSKNFSQ